MNPISPIWQDFITEVFIPQISAYRYWIEMKFLPQMQDSILECEAEEIGEVYFERLGGGQRNFIDAASIADQANNKSQNYYIEMTELRQGLLNLLTVGLHHIFEQQLLRLYRKELLDYDMEKIVEDLVKNSTVSKKYRKSLKWLLSSEVVEAMLRDRGIDPSNLAAWHSIRELRRIANSIKHADGESCEQLKKHHPELFVNPVLREVNSILANPQFDVPIFQPLSGESIFVTEEILMQYIEAVTEFWINVSGAESPAESR